MDKPLIVRSIESPSALYLICLIALWTSILVCSGCGGSHPADDAPATSCMGLQCAVVTRQTDLSCPQVNGHNYRWYASATQANLTVYFFYLLETYDEQGNLTTQQKTANLAGSQGVPLTCNYDVNSGNDYLNEISKECATSRAGATLANCTSGETSLTLKSASKVAALAVRTRTRRYEPAKLLTVPSACVDVCKLQTSACLRVGFTEAQKPEMDKAVGILFGQNSKTDVTGCKQSIEVANKGSKGKDRIVSAAGSDKGCVTTLDSGVGPVQIFVSPGSAMKTLGDSNKFAMAPSTAETAVIVLPDEWEKKYGGSVLAAEGTQASTVITTETGCIRLQRPH